MAAASMLFAAVFTAMAQEEGVPVPDGDCRALGWVGCGMDGCLGHARVCEGASPPRLDEWNDEDGLSCCPEVDVSVFVSHAILGEGFHPTLAVRAAVESPSGLPSPCRIIFRQALPPGLYVDPYEATRAEAFGGPRVRFVSPVRGRVDTECMAHLAKSSRLVIDPRAGAGLENFNFSVQLHARYQPPSHCPGISHVQVPVPPPEPRIACECTAGSVHRTCAVRTSDKADLASCPVEYVKVPVASMAHSHLVTVGTAAAVLLGAFALIHALLW